MIGTRVGSYEITAKLGEGGMGEVYRATDTKLRREVAIKVLPAAFTEDSERLARFEREAQLLAQLHHPNIASIFGLEESGGVRALVMELVEGPTLAERLESGSLPLAETLAIARQIAEALEEAHEKGIVHRDLKPQNVKAAVEGKVKVLDFGLAKAMDPTGTASGSPSQLAQSPTLTLGATQMGVILGTAAYMAPEQAKGTAVDKRADIWAFGVVLYEMLCGRRLFDGETVPETLAGVIRAEIDFGALPPDTPPALRRLLARCLERNPKNRLRDIGEARVALERAASGPAEETAPAGAVAARHSPWIERIGFALGALLLATAVWKVAPRSEPPAARSAARLQLLPPEGLTFNVDDGPVTLSPDGESIVFLLTEAEGGSQLAVRRLDSFDVRRLPGASGGYEPFWSADGRSIGYFDTHLSKVGADGLQPAQKLAPVRDARGGAWNQRGVILYAPDPAGVLYRVDAAGGDPVAVTRLDPDRRETAHLRPSFLPDGEHFLYLVRTETPETSGIYVGSLDGKLKKRVLALDTAARFAPPGYLLVVQEGRLIARRFDTERLEVVGEPAALADGVEYIAQYDGLPVSASGQERLLYHPASSLELRQTWRIDRTGKKLGTIGEPGDFNLDLSPGGRRLAVAHLDPATRRPFLWVQDLERDARFRLDTSGPANGPVWSPDGREIAYVMVSSTEPRLAIRPADGGAERVVWRDATLSEAIDWSPDGRSLLAEVISPGAGMNLILLPASGTGPVEPFATTPANEASGRFSPDGRYIAYVSNASERNEIYVEPLPRTGAKWIASRRGGDAPRWSGDGRELYFVEPGGRDGSGTLMAVTVAARGGELSFGVPTALGPAPSSDLEVAAGGREFLVGAPVRAGIDRPPVLIENWTSLLAPR